MELIGEKACISFYALIIYPGPCAIGSCTVSRSSNQAVI